MRPGRRTGAASRRTAASPGRTGLPAGLPASLRARRNPNAPVVGSRSFVRWYERVGSGLALLAVVLFTGVVVAISLVILIGLLMVVVGGSIG